MTRPTEPPTFFVDRCLGGTEVAEALRTAGARVEVHDDHFAQDEEDDVWLDSVGKRGWIVLTKDKRIRHRRIEIAALMRAGAGAFTLTAGDLRGADMAKLFVSALPRMIRISASRVRPFVATISRSGHIQMIEGGRRRGGVKR